MLIAVTSDVSHMDSSSREDEQYIEQTIQLARQAAERGDRPCGSLLVHDSTVLERDTNRVYSGDDIALHPELSLARWASRELTADEQAETTLYTTVEPCSMCATALALTNLGRVVFCVSGARYWTVASEIHDSVPNDYIPCSEVLGRLGADTAVTESVLEEKGLVTIKACLGLDE